VRDRVVLPEGPRTVSGSRSDPQDTVWVYCGSGYRSSIAASALDRPGRHLVLINDAYDAAADAGLE